MPTKIKWTTKMTFTEFLAVRLGEIRGELFNIVSRHEARVKFSPESLLKLDEAVELLEEARESLGTQNPSTKEN